VGTLIAIALIYRQTFLRPSNLVEDLWMVVAIEDKFSLAVDHFA